MGDQEKTSVVVAPQFGSSDKSAQVISVELTEDEDVLWQWTHYPDGTSAVTGYEIIKKSERSND
ncbi:MAG: hypothetical protein L0220_32400 [Acidobacteria bacterium]|nr:hypothetical protein [Acidobacteriota bacterium]